MIAAAGALLNSALYLVAVFAAGMATRNPAAWMLAIAAMGVTYLSHLAAIPRLAHRVVVRSETAVINVTPRWQVAAQTLLTLASILLAAAAGVALLF
jgi:hypothetical protein